ncbi:metalloendopeptidase [Aureococcus anophagefferens]|uniref:Metalloendopeptidase n=1 Tax=Aureococcus anophagefferens TaxID=44056 RepID=A0ABR1GED9_AURAN
MTDATTIRYLEASISELAPKEFDAAAFYRSKLRKTASVQIVRVSRRDLDEGGGISVVVSGASREVAKLWRAWSERRTYIHANRKCVLWALHAPSEPPARGGRAARRWAPSKEAFLKHDLYGDRTMPGEMAWAALPKALAEVCDALTAPLDVAASPRALDVPPHYPVDIAQFRRIVDELDAGGARDADLRRQSWVDKDQQRRWPGARYRESRAARANAGTFCDAEPLMDPETRAIRRSAVRARHRRARTGARSTTPGATGASVAAALLIRRSGRDVRLGGSGARRTLHFPRRRRRRRAGPLARDADDSGDDGDAGLGGRPSCSAFTRAL